MTTVIHFVTKPALYVSTLAITGDRYITW